MSHRTQITLTDEQYVRLCEESERTGLALAELVRQALDGRYGSIDAEARRKAFDHSFGVWGDRDFDSVEYVDQLRRGMGRRLARLTESP